MEVNSTYCVSVVVALAGTFYDRSDKSTCHPRVTLCCQSPCPGSDGSQTELCSHRSQTVQGAVEL